MRYVCPVCSRQQEPGGVTRGVLRVELDELPRAGRRPVSTTRSALDGVPSDRVAGLAAAAAGSAARRCSPVPRLRRRLGMPRLWVKDDTRNPSGSTKDRASLLVVAKAVEYGYDTVATASTGNAATALAAVAAAAGVRAVVFVPAAAPPAKLVQMASYGARARAGGRQLRRRVRALARRLRALRLVQPQHGVQPVHDRGEEDRGDRDRGRPRPRVRPTS